MTNKSLEKNLKTLKQEYKDISKLLTNEQRSQIEKRIKKLDAGLEDLNND